MTGVGLDVRVQGLHVLLLKESFEAVCISHRHIVGIITMKKAFSMTRRIFASAILISITLLVGCGAKDDPLTALEAAVQQLQDNLEGKNTGDVLEQLHPQFSAQQNYDRDWAKRTMLLMFMRHKNVKVIALSKHSSLDNTYRDRGHTEAQVALAGAEGLIPNSAGHYSVKLEWWFEDGEWQLARLNWD
jgi:hypothetical protein